MLLPWSKQTVIAIADDGIAIKQPNKNAVPITAASTDSRITFDALLSALTPCASTLKNTQVRVIISNHFVRYTVLPWQQGVNTRADWLAIAEHTFRKQYGAITQDWTIRVNLTTADTPVVASAIDQSLQTALTQIAESLNFKLQAIEPLLMAVSAHHKNNDSLLIAEPERLLLCELDHGEIVNFTASAPPVSQEGETANQLIARHALQQDRQSTRPVVSYVSSVLINNWSQSGTASNTQQHVIKLNTNQASHACWMAEL